LVLMIVFLFIAWSDDPTVNTPVCTAHNTQVYPRIVSDGFSGAIITWQDNRAGNYDAGNPYHLAIIRLLQFIEREMITLQQIKSDDLFFVLGKSDRIKG